MKQLKGYEIRQMWLDFWESKGHKVVPGASLIPQNDPTLLWINAGVASLKKYFDGREIPENKRMVNVQKSIRTNDIENVGKTARHHTFFEMLGNFSIGDYFKEDAIKWAKEILCDEKWFGLDKEKLYITYYPDDVSTYNLWIKNGISKNHLIPIKDNFWEIGEGPCGPDTEIFYDRGEKYDANHVGIKLLEQDIENDRYIEIWNIVLSQFNSKKGVKRSQYKELPSKNIDTGSGLERLACIMQGAETNYETDLFLPIIKKIEEITGVKYNGQMAFKVISDHIRSTVFAISDGAVFSNEGRGYVLRRILRRAERYGKVLGMNEPFLYNLVDSCINNMKVFYPYLVGKSDLVKTLVKQEEEKFLKTLASGEKRLLNIINNSGTKVISGSDAFLLYDTFGFPIELTADVALEKGFTVDKVGFTKKLNAQKARARKARGNKQSMNGQNSAFLSFDKTAKFVGYKELSITSSVIAIFKEDKQIDKGKGKLLVVFEETPFYGEMGGEIGDKGSIILNGVAYEVTDSIMLPNKSSASVVEMDDEELSVGDIVECVVDTKTRLDIQRNHSATHLLNEALREVVGPHVHQQSSNVSDKLLRFDFNNLNSLTEIELIKIEKIVNDKISQNIAVRTYELPIEEAKKLGAQAVFGEKYGKIVRVVDMTYSKELCGGCHVQNTADIEKFAIISFESKGSGVYRIEASTAGHIKKEINKRLANTVKTLKTLESRKAQLLKDSNMNLQEKQYKVIEDKYILHHESIQPIYEPSYKYICAKKAYLESEKEVVKQLEKEYNKYFQNNSALSLDSFLSEVREIKGINVLISRLEDVKTENLKNLVDRLSDKLGESLIIFANVTNGKIVFICKSSSKGLNAGKLVKLAATVTGGNGGGRPDFAQAGGKDISKINEAFEKVLEEIGK